jgi:hypothetical protein
MIGTPFRSVNARSPPSGGVLVGEEASTPIFANVEGMAVAAAVAPIPLQRQLTWWVLALPVVMIVAIAARNVFLLNWIHVLSGTLWTGADIFMGFILGPVLRRLAVPQRTAVISFLVPRTLLYFPAVSLTTSTAGWFLAGWLGMLAPASAQFPWVVVALVLVTFMTILGLGLLLPNSLRIWLELQKSNPNRDLIVGLNRFNILTAGAQGLMQVAIIVVMSHLAIG